MKRKRVKTGFTLAEVLITLGIIGIVAAMTLPTLFGNIRKKQTVAKLQKAIAEINQAYKLSSSEIGDINAEDAKKLGSKEYFAKYWAPYIKVSTYCTTAERCGYKDSIFRNLKGNSWYSIMIGDNIGDISTAFLTHSGIYYSIRTGTGAGDNQKANSIIIVDINGAKNPNVIGKDVFWLERINDEKGSIILPYCNSSSDAVINKDCKKDSNGGCCAEKIKRAGWKIDSTYPW